ncbi:hypothetical protein [Streptomyces malaysiensis]|uniref:hypothetical protein n=1 Tax=Streptomyces malaysiensis TaxID=92644 RepID=UPI0011CE6274|nr:hypothetical protein [Streptomyces malaysiensis]
MCISVQYAPIDSLKPWDADRQVITLPDHLTGAVSLRALRAVLLKLAIPQPESGAVCWCGERIRLLDYVAQQQRSSELVTEQMKVIRHGA